MMHQNKDRMFFNKLHTYVCTYIRSANAKNNLNIVMRQQMLSNAQENIL